MTPRGPFNWTAEDVIRFLKEYGFTHTHTCGSHMFYAGRYSGQFRQVSVPFHGSKALKPRTLKSIILQSGISKTEWMNRA